MANTCCVYWSTRSLHTKTNSPTGKVAGRNTTDKIMSAIEALLETAE